MKVLYSNEGFEQDSTPQICVEGSNLEYISLIHAIEDAMKNNREGDFLCIPYNRMNNENILILANNKGCSKVIFRFESNIYKMSLDMNIWFEVIDLLKPLTIKKGYQFIEFDRLQLIGELGLIFRAI